jgi:two-component system cell cycle sensor histidine kinase/response regulator CckA
MKTTAQLFNGKSKNMRTILLVEKNPLHVLRFRDIITPLGFDCVHMEDLLQRRDIFSSTPFICIVDVTGNKKADVKDFMRKNQVTNPYSVCIVTAETASRDKALEYLDMGAYEFLEKPFAPLPVGNLLQRCLERITLQIDNNRLQNQVYEVRNEARFLGDMLSMVLSAAKRFISCNYLHELGGVIMDEFSHIFNIMGGSLFILEDNKLQRIFSLDPGHTPEEIPLPLKSSSFFGQVMHKKEPLLVNDLSEEKRFVASGWDGYKKESFLILPLIHNTHNFVGCVSLHDKEDNGFTAEDEKIGSVLSGLSASMIHTMRGIEKLRENEEKLRYFFEENPAADFIVTPQGRTTLYNPAFTRLIGQTRNNDGVEYDIPDLYGSREEWKRVVEIIRDKKKVDSYETEFTKDDGSSISVIGNYQGRFDESGELLDIKGMLIDVTQRKRLEEQLNHSMKMEAVGRFAGSIAHDFNNLVTAILGYSDLCLRVLDEKDSLYADISEIKHAANMAADLTKKLLYFSKKQKIRPANINLNRILSEMDGMLRRLLGEEIEFTTALDPRLCVIKADPSQIEQVIMNLVVNARDAMPKGGRLTIKTRHVRIHATGEKQDLELTPGSYVMLSIEDTGMGMDAQTKFHIFEPFFSTKPKDKGTGLGLSTVYAIMKNNRGVIKVESARGKGSVFSLYFPALGEKKDKEEQPLPRQIPGKATILLVEDKEIVSGVVERVLHTEGYAVLKAADAEQALAMISLERIEPDILVTDVYLPNMSGYELADNLKARFPELKVIFTSGQLEDTQKSRERMVHSDIDFLGKPFSPEELLRKVCTLLIKK